MSKNDQIQIDVARAQLLSSEADIAMYRGVSRMHQENTERVVVIPLNKQCCRKLMISDNYKILYQDYSILFDTFYYIIQLCIIQTVIMLFCESLNDHSIPFVLYLENTQYTNKLIVIFLSKKAWSKPNFAITIGIIIYSLDIDILH